MPSENGEADGMDVDALRALLRERVTESSVRKVAAAVGCSASTLHKFVSSAPYPRLRRLGVREQRRDAVEPPQCAVRALQQVVQLGVERQRRLRRQGLAGRTPHRLRRRTLRLLVSLGTAPQHLLRRRLRWRAGAPAPAPAPPGGHAAPWCPGWFRFDC